jgi:rod shape-determining protein MreC
MQRLLAFIEHNLHYILFVVLQAFCVFLLLKLSPYQRAYISNSAAIVTANANSFSSEVKTYFSLGKQNLMLQHAMIDSAFLVNPFLNLQHLGDTFEVRDSNQTPLYEMMSAQVVFNTVHKANNVFVINKGSNDGIKKGSGVLSSSGVAGVIIAVGPEFSTAMSVLNTNFRLVPRINGQDYFTDLVWDNSSPYFMKINKINKLEKLKQGDLVTTGSSSLIFPPGIPVGYIESAELIPGSQYLDTELKTATDFRNLNYVFVIYNSRQDEIEAVLNNEESD